MCDQMSCVRASGSVGLAVARPFESVARRAFDIPRQMTHAQTRTKRGHLVHTTCKQTTWHNSQTTPRLRPGRARAVLHAHALPGWRLTHPPQPGRRPCRCRRCRRRCRRSPRSLRRQARRRRRRQRHCAAVVVALRRFAHRGCGRARARRACGRAQGGVRQDGPSRPCPKTRRS